MITTTGQRQALAALLEAPPVTITPGRLPGERLPALDHHVAKAFRQLHVVDAPAGPLASNQLRARARERLVADLDWSGVKLHRQGEHAHRLRGQGVLGLNLC